MEIKSEERLRKEVAEEVEMAKNQGMMVQTGGNGAVTETGTSDLLKNKRRQVLNSAEVNELGEKIAIENVKADLASEAAKINQQNMSTAEQEFDTKTRQRRLERLNAELELQHKYNMSIIKQNGEHQQMLNRRKQLVEKYGYLYDWKEPGKAVDGSGNEYAIPKDFSYSKGVNRFREFGRNISKLDRPLLQTLKWGFIVGCVILTIFILKWTGIIK